MVKKLKSKHNIIKTSDTKNVISAYDEYMDMRTLQKIPVNNVFFDKLAKQMIEAVNDCAVIRMSQIYTKFGMIGNTYHRLLKKSEILKKAHEYCMEIVGERREVLSATGKLQWNVIGNCQPHYCSIAKEMTEWRAKLREQESPSSGIVVVEIPAIEKSSIVPERKNELREVSG